MSKLQHKKKRGVWHLLDYRFRSSETSQEIHTDWHPRLLVYNLLQKRAWDYDSPCTPGDRNTYPVVSTPAMPLSCGMNFRRSKQSKPKRSANTSLYVAHHSSFATSCHNGGQTKEFAFAKLEFFLITAKEKAKKTGSSVKCVDACRVERIALTWRIHHFWIHTFVFSAL